MVRISSLNCLSCRNPYTKALIHWMPPPFSLKTLCFHWKVLRLPFPKIDSYLSPLVALKRCDLCDLVAFASWRRCDFKRWDFHGHSRKEANTIWGTACQNAAYVVAIRDLELRLRGTTRGRGAIWEVALLKRYDFAFVCGLSGPLNRLNAIAILSLLQPRDRYRTLSAIASAIGKALSRPISHARTGRSSQPPRSKPLRGLNRAIVAL